MKNVIIIQADGARREYESKDNPSYEELQKIVGGPPELIPDFPKFEGKRCDVFANEFGKMQQLQHNSVATHAWRTYLDSTRKPYVPDRATLVGIVVVIQKIKKEKK